MNRDEEAQAAPFSPRDALLQSEGMQRERARIVEFLRAWSRITVQQALADAVEAGKHWEEP